MGICYPNLIELKWPTGKLQEDNYLKANAE